MKAFWLSMILSSVSALGPSMARANESCGPFFETEYAMLGRIEVEPGALSGLTASEYATALQRIESLLGTLKVPSEVNIVVHDNMLFSSFFPTELTVYVGLRPGDVLGEKHKNINLTTLTHEYGHAIFDKNLRTQIPSFKATAEKMEKNSDDTFVPYILYTGLHELFADAVTLVATKNPEAISQLTSMPRKSLYRLKKEYATLKKSTPPDEFYLEDPTKPMPYVKKYTREAMSLRNMKDGSDHRLYQKWQELISDKHAKKTNEFIRQDPYFILLPARWHLWQVIKTRVDSENYQKEILGKIFPIFKKEMDHMLAHPPETLSASDVEMLNHRIMRQIDEALL